VSAAGFAGAGGASRERERQVLTFVAPTPVRLHWHFNVTFVTFLWSARLRYRCYSLQQFLIIVSKVDCDNTLAYHTQIPIPLNFPDADVIVAPAIEASRQHRAAGEQFMARTEKAILIGQTHEEFERRSCTNGSDETKRLKRGPRLAG
jgi:hypothetical protein